MEAIRQMRVSLLRYIYIWVKLTKTNQQTSLSLMQHLRHVLSSIDHFANTENKFKKIHCLFLCFSSFSLKTLWLEDLNALSSFFIAFVCLKPCPEWNISAIKSQSCFGDSGSSETLWHFTFLSASQGSEPIWMMVPNSYPAILECSNYQTFPSWVLVLF